jgi:16S rRNA (uracil1498-N3)-methyltransferase
VPLHTERSVATGENVGDKLDRYVIEASKQCGRNRLMEISEPTAWAEWLAADPRARRWVADPTGQPVATGGLASAGPTFAAVGPEGGFTVAERDAARAAGWSVVNLGSRILRIETAAIVLVALATLGCD